MARGGFATASKLTASTAPQYLAVADLNLDKKMDLIVADAATRKVMVFLGDGMGGFASARTLVVNAGPMVTGDFNGDKIPDIAILYNTEIDILSGNGTGGFALTTSIGVSCTNPQSLRAADIDGDTRLDLIIGGDTLAFLIADRNGDGGFPHPAVNLLLDNPQAMAVGDFNGDHFPDLLLGAVASGRLSLLINYSPPP